MKTIIADSGYTVLTFFSQDNTRLYLHSDNSYDSKDWHYTENPRFATCFKSIDDAKKAIDDLDLDNAVIYKMTFDYAYEII